MKNIFLNQIHTGKYEEAKKLITHLSTREFNQFILDLATDTQSIALYTFVCFLLIEHESADLHYCAAGLLQHSFCYVEGAYSAALFHARRAAKLLPYDLSCKVELLNYFGLPEQIMDSTEAKKLAQEILAVEPTHTQALNIIKQLN